MDTISRLRTALAESRCRTDAIFSLIKPQAMYERPIPERHRIIFYLGHLEAFDWNQICRWNLNKVSFHPTFDNLFEAGIDPKEGELPQDQPSDWPSIKEVNRYNQRVRQEIDQNLDQAPEHILHVAIEHRLMHAETTAYILQHVSQEGKRVPLLPDQPSAPVPVPGMIDIPAGVATLGKTHEEGFGWDNEFTAHQVTVPAFAIDKYKVTNGQYLRFVEEGAPPPPFWSRGRNGWVLHTMFGRIPLPLEWPVYVSQREAQAYAHWKGLALPTEAQFHRAAFGTPTGQERRFPWGNDPPNGRHGNFNFAHWDPVSVAATPEGDSAFGVSQLVGNGWEWTSTKFGPFEGFSPLPTYPGYSARFFDHDHFIVKGAGPHTASCLLRRSFRNWFRQGYPHAHAGFRCVQN